MGCNGNYSYGNQSSHGGYSHGQCQYNKGAQGPNGAGTGASDGGDIDGSNDIGTGGSRQSGTSDPALTSNEQRLLDEINRVRGEYGLKPLKNLPNLNQGASDNDADNNATGVLAHHNDLNLYGASGGEISAFHSAGMTPEAAVNMWLNSPGHRAILLDPNQEYVGVSIDGNYATADFA